jgi:endonuclease/exonuclease/phosphatase (EEP) superfamily protein YafD
MFKRLRLLTLLLHIIEASLVALFFVQATRYLIGAVYSAIGSASLVAVLDPAQIPAGTAGAIAPVTLANELSFLLYMLLLPLLSVLLGRFRWVLVLAALIAAAGRSLMFAQVQPIVPIIGGGIVLGGGLLYIALLIRHRAQSFPYAFIIALGIDQLLRAQGNTLDISWSTLYQPTQIGLSVGVSILAILNWLFTRRPAPTSPTPSGKPATDLSPDQGVLSIWGGIGFGAMLYLQYALFALPNAIAGKANADYTSLVPLTLLATLLPIIPWVRSAARQFIGVFDGNLRGWLWMLLIAILIVAGTRLQPALAATGLGIRTSGTVAAAILVIAQVCISLSWWWLLRPQAERERNISGLWLILSVFILVLFVTADVFTFEYGEVFALSGDFSFFNRTVAPLLRGLRGMGLLLLLLALFLMLLPMTQAPRRIAWSGSNLWTNLGALALVIGASIGGAFWSRPPVVIGVRDVDTLRLASYNINGGYSEFYYFDLEMMANNIARTGASIVLLQEVDMARMTSFGVDQTLWLARRLNMDRRFYATNEGLQGLAVLSKAEIVFDDGALLTSLGTQTGVQRVQVRVNTDANPITVYNLWFGYLTANADGTTNTTDEQAQLQQLSEVFALISLHHPNGQLGKTVIGGTFNNTPESPLLQRMRENGYIDPFTGLPIEISVTLRRLNQSARIDYLWLRNLPQLSAAVSIDQASDHGIVIVEVIVSRD